MTKFVNVLGLNADSDKLAEPRKIPQNCQMVCLSPDMALEPFMFVRAVTILTVRLNGQCSWTDLG